MRAILIESPGEPENLKLTELPIPIPNSNEVRIKVAYCSMNPMDVFARRGKVNWLPIKWPFIPGIEHAGVVDAVGKNVNKDLLGKRVHSRNVFTGNAEYSIAPKDKIHPFPKDLDWRTGTVYGGMTHTAYHVLHTAVKVKKEDWCLFHSAAGAIGIMLTQIAKDTGAQVIGLCSKNKFDYVRSFGADYLIDYTTENWIKKVNLITEQAGANIIVDGNQGLQANKNFEVISPGGHIIYIGATSGHTAPAVDIPTLIFKSAFVGGFNLPLLESLGARDSNEVLEKVIEKKWKIPITEEVELENVPELNARFENREIKGRAIIKVGGELEYDA